ncbi:DNA mismatch repair protein [Capnocytophaga canimorsus]|uniref:MutS-related protein n=1 Tax=Capnocytophaga canimorsus TaxID=28188 RepID=UPI0037D13049
MQEKYIAFIEKYQKALHKQSQISNRISFLRLLLALLLVFSLYKTFTQEPILPYLVADLVLIITFVVLLKIHQKNTLQRKLTQTLLQINKAEYDYLTENKKPWYDGASYINPQHDYSYDLDIFGTESLYHHLNRTATEAGKYALAQELLSHNTSQQILKKQKATDELAKEVVWRQEFYALAKMVSDLPDNEQKLRHWAKQNHIGIHRKWQYVAYISPILFFLNLLLVYVFEIRIVPVYFFFTLNLVIAYAHLKPLLKESLNMGRIFQTMQFYKRLFEKIEEANFQSETLQQLQKQLKTSEYKASAEIARLGNALGQLDSISNILASVVFNGTLLYHLHIYFSVIRWKRQYAHLLPLWLDTVGTFEAISSVANHTFNHPHYVFPELNETHRFEFSDLGHPLIMKNGVRNDFHLGSKQMILLTGSNMSGKSTFLRTIGTNLILAQVGAKICATKATLCPIRVVTSMRQFDSLSSGESYFFAEIKRLKHIMEQLTERPCFVLLDEILRGTNSDDKQQGTKGVLVKLLSLSAQGILATHDLEICKMTEQYPQLSNFRFEGQIINNELYFDYKLKSGVCTNKSATFLMKKLEIIS